MKTLKDLRTGLPERMNRNTWFQIKYFIEDKFDFNVFLPTYNTNLQRDLVWTLEQKQELIWSILMDRYIPNIAAIKTFNKTWQIIDGKQRLNAIFSFYKNEFPINIDGVDYYYDTIENYNPEFKSCFLCFGVNVDYVFESKENEYSDEFKVNWFKFLNFAGTPQDKEHLNKFKNND